MGDYEEIPSKWDWAAATMNGTPTTGDYETV
jgi:hypothetical protein